MNRWGLMASPASWWRVRHTLIEGYDVKQWLVTVDPHVSDHGVETDRVLVDVHELLRVDGPDWLLGCTGVYSLSPTAVRRDGRFRIQDTVGGHKMTATNCPDRVWIRSER